MEFNSPNFAFLADLDPPLMHQAAMAECYCLDDPCTALTKLRLFGELLAKNIAARHGIYTDDRSQQHEILRELRYRDALDPKLAEMFHNIRKAGNDAVHQGKGTVREALQNLRFAHQLAVYFYRIFRNRKFKSGPFQVPPNPADGSDTLKSELEIARNQILELQGQVKDAAKLTKAEVGKRKAAENDAAKAWTEFNAALELAQLTEEQAQQDIALYEEELQRLQAKGARQTEQQRQQTVAFSKSAADQVDLTEADTRILIDRQLQTAGWEADTAEIRHSKGIRPEKGKNKAIAEWPTQRGPADYVLFNGLTAMAVVEAKRKNIDVYSAVDQAKRYSKGFAPDESCQTTSGP